MPTRDTDKLKELIQAKLDGDTGVGSLRELLGGTGRVFQGNPNHKKQYPCTTWTLDYDIDEPFNCDIPTGIVKSILSIDSFIEGVDSDNLGPISDRIFFLLNGQALSNSDIIVYSCLRVTNSTFPEADAKVWRNRQRYELTNVPA